MSPELHRRLKELDRMGDLEAPPDLNFRAAVEEIGSHKETIERILGCPLKTDGTQDASYLLDFFIQDERFVNMKMGNLVATQIVQIICVRFSAFDRMFTLFGTEFEKFSDRLPPVIAYLESHKFNYISMDDLAETYDGCEHGTVDATWFGRFFDYV